MYSNILEIHRVFEVRGFLFIFALYQCSLDIVKLPL